MVSGNARQYLRTFRRKGNAMKKTALDDDAYLYQKREEKTEKEKWSEMNRHQRMQYFLDYYLVKLLVFTGIILAVVLFVWNFISKSKEDTVLYVAVVDEVLQTEGTEKLKEELTEYLVPRYLAASFNKRCAASLVYSLLPKPDPSPVSK